MRLSAARGDGVPVLDPLRLVDDDQFRCPRGDQVEIGPQLFVVGDLAEIIGAEILLPLRPAAVDHPRRHRPEKRRSRLATGT